MLARLSQMSWPPPRLQLRANWVCSRIAPLQRRGRRTPAPSLQLVQRGVGGHPYSDAPPGCGSGSMATAAALLLPPSPLTSGKRGGVSGWGNGLAWRPQRIQVDECMGEAAVATATAAAGRLAFPLLLS